MTYFFRLEIAFILLNKNGKDQNNLYKTNY